MELQYELNKHQDFVQLQDIYQGYASCTTTSYQNVFNKKILRGLEGLLGGLWSNFSLLTGCVIYKYAEMLY